MTDNLENRAEPSHKIKPWETIVPVIGTGAYLIRCSRDPQFYDTKYSNEVLPRFIGLLAKDIFIGTAVALYPLIQN